MAGDDPLKSVVGVIEASKRAAAASALMALSAMLGPFAKDFEPQFSFWSSLCCTVGLYLGTALVAWIAILETFKKPK